MFPALAPVGLVEVMPLRGFAGVAPDTGADWLITVWDEAGVKTDAAGCAVWLALDFTAVAFAAGLRVAVFAAGAGFFSGGTIVVCAPAVRQAANAIVPANAVKEIICLRFKRVILSPS
jgi:hypothetical protein